MCISHSCRSWDIPVPSLGAEHYTVSHYSVDSHGIGRVNIFALEMSLSKEIEAKQENSKHQDHDELSDAASSRAEEQTLAGDDLPSYEETESASASASASREFPPEKTTDGQPIGPTASAPFNFPTAELPPEKRVDRKPIRPTASAPFNFPTAELPSYAAANDIRRPIAIPQLSQAPTAPLLFAYPTELINYGIPPDSWYNFLNTTSAFLSANVSKQALHHAAHVGNAMGDYQRQYANHVKKSVKAMGKSAKNFNPFGLFGGFVGLTVGAAGHVVGSLASGPLSMMKKPQNPRERALAYLATANLHWFHSRALHAVLCDTQELAMELNVHPQHFLQRAWNGEKPAQQMQALSEWIGQVQVDDPESKPSSMMDGAGPSSKKQTWTDQLQLGPATLWLVLIPQKQNEGMINPNKAYEGT